MILTSIKIIKITFHECDEPFALGARNDYLLKEIGPYPFKMLCKCWCSSQVDVCCGDRADCIEMEEVLVVAAGLGDIMIYTTHLNMQSYISSQVFR